MTYQRRPGRQLERRGDLSGLAFVAFAAAMLVALGAVALLFTSLPPRDEPPIGAASPSRSPGPTTTAPLVPSPLPSSSVPPSGSPPAAITFPPSSEVPTPTPPPLVPVAMGEPAQIVIDGAPAGTVRVISTGIYTRLDGIDAPFKRRWFAVEVEYVADPGPLPYAAADWRAIDTRGRVFEAALIDIQAPLGTGTLEPGETRRRFVVFAVRPTAAVERLELLGPDGVPMLAFSVS